MYTYADSVHVYIITGGDCCGQITARMCASNKIPANYYYDDGFLEANWPLAKFIHLANVLHVRHGAPTTAPCTCMCLCLGIGQESSWCSTGGHLSHNS
jgi:hypothetical protein